MNRLQKLVIILTGIVAISALAVVGIFASVIGAIVLPFFRPAKPGVPRPEAKPEPLKNMIDAEFTRIDNKSESDK